MALDYFLELEGETPNWEACIQSLKSVGLIDLVVEDGRFKRANLTSSGMHCWSSKVPEDEDTSIAAQGNHGCKFQSRYSGISRENRNAGREHRRDPQVLPRTRKQIPNGFRTLTPI